MKLHRICHHLIVSAESTEYPGVYKKGEEYLVLSTDTFNNYLRFERNICLWEEISPRIIGRQIETYCYFVNQTHWNLLKDPATIVFLGRIYKEALLLSGVENITKYALPLVQVHRARLIDELKDVELSLH